MLEANFKGDNGPHVLRAPAVQPEVTTSDDDNIQQDPSQTPVPPGSPAPEQGIPATN